MVGVGGGLHHGIVVDRNAVDYKRSAYCGCHVVVAGCHIGGRAQVDYVGSTHGRILRHISWQKFEEIGETRRLQMLHRGGVYQRCARGMPSLACCHHHFADRVNRIHGEGI